MDLAGCGHKQSVNNPHFSYSRATKIMNYNDKRGGYLFVAVGCMFFIVALASKQGAFVGVGGAFLGAGVARLRKSK